MMTNRPMDPFSKDCNAQTESRLNQQIRCCKSKSEDEGCPVIDESGTVCGETDSLSIFNEFRKIYEDCLKKLEESPNGTVLLGKLTPFTKIVDDLWEQNTMLVEAVEELEQEATCQVTSLQNKLDKSCQKIFKYRNDVESLVEMIRRLKEENIFDSSGLTFYTLCPDCMFGNCSNRSSVLERDSVRKSRKGERSHGVYASNSSDADCSVGYMENFSVCGGQGLGRLNESKKVTPCISSRGYCSRAPTPPPLRIPSRIPSGMSCGSLSEDDVSLSEDTSGSRDCIKLLNELHCILKTKEREIQNLNQEISNKNELLAKNRCQIQQLEEDLKAKTQHCRGLIKRLKSAAVVGNESRKSCDNSNNNNEVDNEEEGDCDEYDCCDTTALDMLINDCVTELVNERNSSAARAENVERQIETMATEKKKAVSERNEMGKRLQSVLLENERLTEELTRSKESANADNEELKRMVDALKGENTELLDRIGSLHKNVKDLNTNFNETRWALTVEVAEKHDQVQELKKCVKVLEEQLMQTNKQLVFKEDVVKELRRELKLASKSGHLNLYDIVDQLQWKKSSKNERTASTATFAYCSDKKSPNMSCPSPCQDGPDSGFFSTATLTPERIGRKKTTAEEDSSGENARLRSQLECLKNSLDSRMKDLRIQEELTRDLEEELDRTKLDLTSLQEKCERRERRQKSVTINSLSDPGLSWRYGTLYCAVNKVEETLRNLSEKHSCGLSECKTLIEEEMEKIVSVKNDLKNLEVSKLTNESNASGKESNSSYPTVQLSCCDAYKPLMPSLRAGSGCTLVHLNDVEEFREKALTGAATLEEMKEQIDILENTVKKYIGEFPCECDKFTLSSCEEKLETLRSEFDEVTDQLCTVIQKFHAYNPDIESGRDSQSSSVCCGARTEEESLARLRSDSQRLHREICQQENEVEKLQDLYRQLDEELDDKKKELFDHKRDLESKTCEVIRLRDLMEEVSRKLRGDACGSNTPRRSPSLGNAAANLRTLFTAMRDFGCLLENASEALTEGQKFEEENEELKNKVACLEKYVRNKEETLKVLQDTVKLKECQIEEIKLKVESSENETSKLTQDVEEKCRLIANLQDAVRKCKQFEMNMRSSHIESLEFEICGLNNKLKKSEKEITLRERKLESLRNQILVMSSKNIQLHRELNVLEPRLKSMYKTCHVFEKMVNDLQGELNVRQCEVDGLCEKIRELEGELDSEFKKCESRALEDSKYIDDLSVAVKDFQRELCLARENYNVTIAETEEKFMKEREMYEQKEREYREEIGELKSEIEGLKIELEAADNSDRIAELELLLRKAESRRLGCEKRIAELENVLQCTLLEHEEERKSILEKLCDEKRENVKNKTLITKLNESVKRKMAAEKSMRECVERATEDAEILRAENEELKTEVETRKNMMSAMERHENVNLSDLEELIGRLKMQKADVKSRCSSLRTELDKELKLKRVLECRVDDLNSILESKLQEFDEMVKNYKCTSSKLQQTLGKIKEAEDSSIIAGNDLRPELESDELNECEYLKRMVDSKAAENARLFSRLLVSKVEMEALQTEYFSAQANKDCLISRLRYEASCLEKNNDVLREKWERCQEENSRLRGEMDCLVEKTTSLQVEFREKQKEMCSKLRSALCEKNDLLNSVDKLQRQLEQICLENVNQEEMNRELSQECSRLRINNDANESCARNKSDKIICNLSKEVKNLQRELCSVRESYENLNVDYQNLVEEFKCLDRKKVNLEKLYHQINNENGQLQEAKLKMEKELCEVKNQNMLLREKIASSTPATFGPSEDTQVLRSKLKELTMKVKTFEKRIIPGLEQDIADKSCCIENMSAEIRDANISSQRMRNEALRVIQHTKKYLAAQRCANEALKSRLECSNKRGNLLGAENRDLEEQLKAVTRMNEFLLCQLENAKSDVDVEDPPSGSTLPWGCATVERDTSSSEYLAESGIQSMQQSPTNLDCSGYDFKHDPKRTNSQWNSLKRNKHGGTCEYPPFRSNFS